MPPLELPFQVHRGRIIHRLFGFFRRRREEGLFRTAIDRLAETLPVRFWWIVVNGISRSGHPRWTWAIIPVEMVEPQQQIVKAGFDEGGIRRNSCRIYSDPIDQRLV